MRYIHTYSGRHCFLTMSLALSLLLLAACGTNGVTATGNSGLATTVTVSAPGTTATVSVKNSPVKQPPAQNCGAVHSTSLRMVPTDQDLAKGVEDCFWQAYQQCHLATLIYSQTSVDTAVIHNFSLKSQNGECMITDTLQHVIAPQPPRPAGNYICAALVQQTDGLHFLACGTEGNVLVPAAGAQ